MRIAALGLVAAASAIVAEPALAQVAVDWQGSASASVGVTSNVANTAVPAKDAPKGTPYPMWDGFGSITPAIELIVETPRTTNTFSYAFDYHFFFLHHEANAVSNTVGYTFAAALSPTVDFTLGLSGAQTQLSVFDVTGTADQARPLATPSGNNYLFTGVVNQAFTVAASDLDTFAEGAAFTANDNVPNGQTVMPGTTPTPSTQTYLGSSTLSYSHSFEYDTLGTTIGNEIGLFPETATGGVTTPAHADLVHRATIDWHRDWSPSWSTSISAGAMVAYVAAKPEPKAQPDVRASVDYETDLGSAGLEYSHSAQPNVLLGVMTLADSGLLHGEIPIKQTGFDLDGSAEFLASRPLLATGGYGQVNYNFLVDAALGYQRDPLPLRFELRYQLLRQFALTDPIAGQPAVPEIRHTNVLFTVTWFFPHAPPAGRHGPSLVPLPSPGSNPGDITHREATRGQMEDQDRQDAHDRREKSEKKSGEGGGEGGGEGEK
jgi:hypothetical protein